MNADRTANLNSHPAPLRLGRYGLALGWTAWAISIGGIMALLADYGTRPGETGAAPDRIASATVAASDRPRLLMFVHPRCPCTAASVVELGRVVQAVDRQVDAVVYLYRPDALSDDWTEGTIRSAAQSIPGVRTVVDPEGRIAERFGANTSGDVLLYDAEGRLRFHGGITPARGHEGDSLGKSALIGAIRGEPAAETAPVFGCTLRPKS